MRGVSPGNLPDPPCAAAGIPCRCWRGLDRSPCIPLDALHDRGVGPGNLLDPLLHRGRGTPGGSGSGLDRAGDISLNPLHDRGMGPDDLRCRLLGSPNPAGDGSGHGIDRSDRPHRVRGGRGRGARVDRLPERLSHGLAVPQR
jgi:hypothetical protein